jgi:hypothetical protein
MYALFVDWVDGRGCGVATLSNSATCAAELDATWPSLAKKAAQPLLHPHPSMKAPCLPGSVAVVLAVRAAQVTHCTLIILPPF